MCQFVEVDAGENRARVLAEGLQRRDVIALPAVSADASVDSGGYLKRTDPRLISTFTHHTPHITLLTHFA